MTTRSIKDHPLYQRIRQVPAAEIASWSLGAAAVESVDVESRRGAFRAVARRVTSGRAERAKHGFNSDVNGEIARALEWAFQAGRRSARPGPDG